MAPSANMVTTCTLTICPLSHRECLENYAVSPDEDIISKFLYIVDNNWGEV